MITTDPQKLREAIAQIENGRQAMMRNDSFYFSWSSIGSPLCGTPGCCFGYIVDHNQLHKSYHPSDVDLVYDEWADYIGLSTAFSRYVFMMNSLTSTNNSKLCKLRRKMHIYNLDADLCDPKDRNEANRRMLKLLNYLRRRLAIVEVETENGWQIKATEMPSGNRKEELVSSKIQSFNDEDAI